MKLIMRNLLLIVFFNVFITTSFASEMNPTVWNMVNPLDNMDNITSPWGDRIHPIYGTIKHHRGIDIGADYGQPVYAVASGSIAYAGWAQGYGNYIEIDHGGGIVTAYGHNESITVSEGMEITQGQIIAYAGSTGNSTGPHLHFEILINGTDVNPSEYLSGLPPSMGLDYGTMASPVKLSFQADYDFGKPLREAIEMIGKSCTEALSNIKEIMNKLIMVLMTIDLALGAAMMTIDSKKEGNQIFSWIVYKLFMYILLIFFLANWGSYIANMSKDLFAGLGGAAMGVSAEDAGMAISNPMDIVQKGANIVAPIFAQLGNITGLMSLVISMNIFIPCITFGVILTACFLLIGIQITMAYIEFYVVILFSFSTFFFSGLKQTRKYAANGLNGIFAAAIKMMFFCIFSLMLQNVMQHITIDDFFSTEREVSSSVMQPAGTTIDTLDDLIDHIRTVESHGDYAADNGDHFGAYQIAYSNWNNWCEDYIANGGNLDMQTPGPVNEPSGFNYPANQANQDMIIKYILGSYVNDYGIENGAKAWNQGIAGMEAGGGDEYWELVSNANPDTGGFSGRPIVITNYLVLFKITICALAFVWMGDKIGSLIMKQFGGSGFKFTNGG